jgi:hypothetical protein
MGAIDREVVGLIGKVFDEIMFDTIEKTYIHCGYMHSHQMGRVRELGLMFRFEKLQNTILAFKFVFLSLIGTSFFLTIHNANYHL